LYALFCSFTECSFYAACVHLSHICQSIRHNTLHMSEQWRSHCRPVPASRPTQCSSEVDRLHRWCRSSNTWRSTDNRKIWWNKYVNLLYSANVQDLSTRHNCLQVLNTLKMSGTAKHIAFQSSSSRSPIQSVFSVWTSTYVNQTRAFYAMQWWMQAASKSSQGEIRGGFGRQLYDTTPHYMTSKRITNNKVLSSKSPLSFPPGLWDIFSWHNNIIACSCIRFTYWFKSIALVPNL